MHLPPFLPNLAVAIDQAEMGCGVRQPRTAAAKELAAQHLREVIVTGESATGSSSREAALDGF